MSNKFFRGNHLRPRVGYQALEGGVPSNKKVALVGAAQDENVIRMHQTISQGAYSREQGLSLREIQWQHAQMIPDLFELGRLAASAASSSSAAQSG